MNQHDGDLQPIEIDLDIMNKGELNESWLSMFGGAISAIMSRMFGGAAIPVKIRGNKDQVRDFARTIGREKKYIRSADEYHGTLGKAAKYFKVLSSCWSRQAFCSTA